MDQRVVVEKGRQGGDVLEHPRTSGLKKGCEVGLAGHIRNRRPGRDFKCAAGGIDRRCTPDGAPHADASGRVGPSAETPTAERERENAALGWPWVSRGFEQSRGSKLNVLFVRLITGLSRTADGTQNGRLVHRDGGLRHDAATAVP